jgi:hypothetical protein
LARRIGAAGKAVVYQWESRKRTPSPVLWQQVMRLQLVGTDMAASTLGERRASVAARARRPFPPGTAWTSGFTLSILLDR